MLEEGYSTDSVDYPMTTTFFEVETTTTWWHDEHQQTNMRAFFVLESNECTNVKDPSVDRNAVVKRKKLCYHCLDCTSPKNVNLIIDVENATWSTIQAFVDVDL